MVAAGAWTAKPPQSVKRRVIKSKLFFVHGFPPCILGFCIPTSVTFGPISTVADRRKSSKHLCGRGRHQNAGPGDRFSLFRQSGQEGLVINIPLAVIEKGHTSVAVKVRARFVGRISRAFSKGGHQDIPVRPIHVAVIVQVAGDATKAGGPGINNYPVHCQVIITALTVHKIKRDNIARDDSPGGAVIIKLIPMRFRVGRSGAIFPVSGDGRPWRQVEGHCGFTVVLILVMVKQKN